MPGPPENPNARRRNKRALRKLPAGGRPGEPPEFPLSRPSVAVRVLWIDLWRTPQAAAWEELGWTRVVARYAKKCVMAEEGSAPVTLLAEVRQLEDRLGLNPLSMKRLGWAIVASEDDQEQDADVANLDDYRKLYGE